MGWSIVNFAIAVAVVVVVVVVVAVSTLKINWCVGWFSATVSLPVWLLLADCFRLSVSQPAGSR